MHEVLLEHNSGVICSGHVETLAENVLLKTILRPADMTALI